MEAVCRTLDQLRHAKLVIGSSVSLDLPVVATVGAQSVGKSSVLESIIGREILPVGPKGVTKCAIEVRLTASAVSEDAFEFKGLPYSSTTAIKAALSKAMQTSDISARLNVTYSSQANPNLTLVDLPPLAQASEPLILQYISQPGTLILALIQAADHTLNTSILNVIRQVDPLGYRTIAVITKVDLLGKDVELQKMLSKSLRGLQSVAVICRSPTDIVVKVSLPQHRRVERNFFQSHQKVAVADHHGLDQLLQRIEKYLLCHLGKAANKLKREAEMQIQSLNEEQKKFGPAVPADQEGQSRTLYALLVAYEKAFRDIFSGSEEVYHMRVLLNTHLQDRLASCSLLPTLSDDTLVTLISNARGLSGSVFLPRLALELLVKLECPVYLQESLCVLQQIGAEVGEAAGKCMRVGVLSNFPVLQDAIQREMEPFLREGQEEASEYITALVEVQEAYLNVQHPSFIGSTEALRSVTQSIDWQQPPSGRVFEARVLRLLAESYTSLLRTQICDQVPKSIIKFIFSPLHDQLFGQLAAKLLVRERFAELLQEVGMDKTRRDECVSSLKGLHETVAALKSLVLYYMDMFHTATPPVRSNCYAEDLADLAYITPEAFPTKQEKGAARGKIEDYKGIYRPPHVTSPVSEKKLTVVRQEVPKTPEIDRTSYQYQRNLANFHMDESRLTSPTMVQAQFEANASKFHSNTPMKKDVAAFKTALDPLFPMQRTAPTPPDTQSSEYQRSKGHFYAVTPGASKPSSRHTSS